ncbi:MAG: hypothetical protein J2P54_08795 [Bradyrhizobiaceae bacterium]|nr:hypothetical protein [Bradyrhizobiaceae bacterium]
MIIGAHHHLFLCHNCTDEPLYIEAFFAGFRELLQPEKSTSHRWNRSGKSDEKPQVRNDTSNDWAADFVDVGRISWRDLAAEFAAATSQGRRCSPLTQRNIELSGMASVITPLLKARPHTDNEIVRDILVATLSANRQTRGGKDRRTKAGMASTGGRQENRPARPTEE